VTGRWNKTNKHSSVVRAMILNSLVRARGGGEYITFEAKSKTLKKFEAKAKDRVVNDRLPRNQGQKGSWPRTRGHV